MDRHPIESIMSTTMENIRDMIDVNTIIGDAISTSDGSTVIPISRVSFGFVAGGGEYAVRGGNQLIFCNLVSLGNHRFRWFSGIFGDGDEITLQQRRGPHRLAV